MRLFLVLLFFIESCYGFTKDTLPVSVINKLQEAHISPNAVAIYMLPVQGEKKPLWTYQPDISMAPASAMKLVTTYAALELLGPKYRWQTTFASTAKIKGGVLQGDLYIRGTGDPMINTENVRQMLTGLRNQGIWKIQGNLIIDRSWFIHPLVPAFDDTPELAYNVLPDALLFNNNTFNVTATSDAQAIKIDISPFLPTVQVINHLRVSQIACEKDLGLPQPSITETKEGHVVEFTGEFPANCRGESSYQLIDSVRYVTSLFAHTWKKLGGQWSGGFQEAKMPLHIPILYTYQSPELPYIIHDINTFSNNTMARLLYLTLGDYKTTQAANLKDAQTRIVHWIKGKKLSSQSLVLENGSGLSRKERISARLLAQLINEALHSPVANAFESSLPIVGVSGTMKNRLADHEMAGRAHIKTGYLNGVRAVAGTIDSLQGEKFILVAMVNEKNKNISIALLDEILKHAWTLI